MAMSGADLRRLREITGFTQEQLAEEIGMTRTWIGITERRQQAIERRTEYAVRYLAERRRLRSRRLEEIAAGIAWRETADGWEGDIEGFLVALRREAQAHWSIRIGHTETGFAAASSRWEASLDDAKASAVLHAHIAKSDLAEYKRSLIA